jgi:homeodomain-containing protein
MGDTLPPSRRGHALEGEKMAPLCGEFGISRKTGCKIFDRYKDCGVAAFSDRSRRPYRQANRLPPQLEATIVRLKREYPAWGAPKIREKLRRQSTAPHLPATQSTDSSTSRFRQGRTSLRSRCHEVFAVNRLHSKDRHAGCLTTLPP